MDQHEMFTEVVENVAKMCAVSAMTAPKSGGQLFLKGSKPFIETTIVKDKETLHRLAEWLRARGTKLKNPIFFRDADTAEKVDLILFHRAREVVSADVRLRRLRVRHLQRISACESRASHRRVPGLGVPRAHLPASLHRPRYSSRIRGETCEHEQR